MSRRLEFQGAPPSRALVKPDYFAFVALHIPDAVVCLVRNPVSYDKERSLECGGFGERGAMPRPRPDPAKGAEEVLGEASPKSTHSCPLGAAFAAREPCRPFDNALSRTGCFAEAITSRGPASSKISVTTQVPLGNTGKHLQFSTPRLKLSLPRRSLLAAETAEAPSHARHSGAIETTEILLQFVGGYLVNRRLKPVLKETQAPSLRSGISNVLVSPIFSFGHCFSHTDKYLSDVRVNCKALVLGHHVEWAELRPEKCGGLVEE
ncbi:hypothetical protein HPB47_023929 [Ixodes persulcatus]|uniref:Uncharacterized protein n=1 Tax=Ixodes persulcatus TaxID=34615 RepID=A0AC60Q5P9_IXOPE|nr:hypothetical protein HPB47_023929 [Ixodes persulcatus]